jgi:hypothetical protein
MYTIKHTPFIQLTERSRKAQSDQDRCNADDLSKCIMHQRNTQLRSTTAPNADHATKSPNETWVTFCFTGLTLMADDLIQSVS